MSKRIVILLALLGLGGCSLPAPPSIPAPEDAVDSRGDGYLREGPTISLDQATRENGPTTLQLLDERVKENARLKSRIEELERSLRAAEEKARQACQDAEAKSAEARQLRSLLEEAVAQQRELTGDVLKARLGRLRLEQEMLRLKIADLVREEPR